MSINTEKDHVFAFSNLILDNIDLFDAQKENNVETFIQLCSSSKSISMATQTSLSHFIAIFALIDFKTSNCAAISRALTFIEAFDKKDNAIVLCLNLLKERNYSQLAYYIAHQGWGIDEARLPYNWRESPSMLVHLNDDDLHLTNRFNNLANLPSESLGRQVYDYLKVQKKPMPGEKGSVHFQATIAHDALHALTGYTSTLDDEILLTGFTMGIPEVNALLGGMLGILLLYNGLPLFTNKPIPCVDIFPIEQWMIAYRMALSTNIDVYHPQWDFWQASSVSVDVLRRRYNMHIRR
jgi:hypothetical protein